MSFELLEPYGVARTEPGEIVAIVGEPGLGKTQLARRIGKSQRNSPARVMPIYLREESTDLHMRLEEALRDARKAARKRPDLRQVVLLDGFPSLGEDELPAIASRIRALELVGCEVVITLRPEAEQLLELLPESRVVGMANLLYRLPAAPDEPTMRAWHLSNGIPMLVEALVGEGGKPGAHYLEQLHKLVGVSVRQGIPQAERELRVAMLLLGRGELADLQEICLGADEETLSWLAEEVPLLGIDLYGATFACAGVADDVMMRACYASLRGFGPTFEDVEDRVFDLLLARRQYLRAGVVCSLMPEPDHRARVALRQGAELALSGAAVVVREGVRAARRLCLQEEPGYEQSSLAINLLDNPLTPALRQDELPVPGPDALCRDVSGTHLALLMAARRVDGGLPWDLTGVQGDDALSEALTEHLSAVRLLLDGCPSAALTRLCSLPLRGEPTSVPEVFLINDLLLAEVLCARRVPSEAVEAIEGACRLLEASRIRRLATYERAMLDVLNVALGGTASVAIDRAVACAEQMRDATLRAVFLIVAALSDVRRGGLAQARVRLARAVEEAASTAYGNLQSWARLLEALVVTRLGEEGALVRLVKGPLVEGLSLTLARMLVHAGCDIGDQLFGEETVEKERSRGVRAEDVDTPALRRLDRDALWLVHVVASDFGTISQLFSLAIPAPWRQALARYGEPASGELRPTLSAADVQNGGRPPAKRKDGGAPQSRKAARGDEAARPRVSLELLGGFRVRVDGEYLPPEVINRRKARVLLALLTARETHSMRRAELVDDIWPHDSFEYGTQRLYEAISSVRRELKAKDRGFDPFLLGRGDGTIALDPDYVSCDVDELTDLAARCVSSDGSDEDVVFWASRACDLYRGEMDQVLSVEMPWVAIRRENLRNAFVDAMVAGARSALRAGRVRMAQRLIQSASAQDDIREDVVAVLIECLCEADRPADAHDAYLRYASHLVSVTGVAPSRQLRRLAASINARGREGGTGQVAFDGQIVPEKEGPGFVALSEDDESAGDDGNGQPT